MWLGVQNDKIYWKVEFVDLDQHIFHYPHEVFWLIDQLVEESPW